MALQSRRLTKGRKTLQDEKYGYVVTRVPPNAFSLSQLCFLIGYISLASSFAYLNQLGENQPISNQQGSTVAQAPSYSWMNPKTKLVATIDGMWTYSAIQNDQKENLYQFQNSNASTVIFFSSENVGASGIGDYVSKFESANASNMKFSDGGVYSDHSGQPSWSTTGTLLTNTEYHFSITVVQNGATFWREVVLQMAPFNFSDSDLMRLESALWSTID